MSSSSSLSSSGVVASSSAEELPETPPAEKATEDIAENQNEEGEETEELDEEAEDEETPLLVHGSIDPSKENVSEASSDISVDETEELTRARTLFPWIERAYCLRIAPALLGETESGFATTPWQPSVREGADAPKGGAEDGIATGDANDGAATPDGETGPTSQIERERLTASQAVGQLLHSRRFTDALLLVDQRSEHVFHAVRHLARDIQKATNAVLTNHQFRVEMQKIEQDRKEAGRRGEQ